MLDNAGKLGKIIIGVNKALGDIPVTVKLRTGVKDGKNTAHKLMPRLAPEFGAACITVCLTPKPYTPILTPFVLVSFTGEHGSSDTPN